MNNLIKGFVFVWLMTCSVFSWAQFSMHTNTFGFEINKKGEITSLSDLKTGTNYAAKEPAYLIQIKVGGHIITPVGFKRQGSVLTYLFPKEYEVRIKAKNQKSHLRFEVISVKSAKKASKVQAVLWGPIKTTISQTIGDFIGVVRDPQFAIGLQGLNVKTTGGDLVNDEGAVYSRGSTAGKRDYGSSIQAFCINRTQPQQIEVWNGFKKARVVGRADFNLEGSAIALFGIQEPKALDLIGKIEIAEGLPHILIDGEWIKNSVKARRPYIISGFGETDVDKMLDFTQKVGFYSLYQSHPFANWGHFDLIPSLFPNGYKGMRNCVDKAKARNIRMGVHTLTNFITTNDPFVTPVPNKGLMVFAQTTISKDIDANSTEIVISDSSHYNKKTTLQTVRIGDELIRFAKVSDSAPYKLEGCKRGAFGTKAISHKKGATIARLIDYPYKTFYPDMNLQNEMIDNLVKFFNETGVSHLDFDGHEGTYATGYGDAAKDYFALRFIKGVNHPVVNGTSRSGHFYWHLNTYMNWGEPWYGGMKESQNSVRFNNQAVLERNYQPNMLGWFWFNSKTTVEEMDWMLARAAGWDAGYALVVNPKDVDGNPHTQTVINHIRIWEEAKNRCIFNEDQKKLMKVGENDFTLDKVNNNEFRLQYYKKYKFVHENIVLQPGQPNYTEWEFSNTTKEQPLYFQLGAKGQDGIIENIVLELDGSNTITIPVNLKAGYSIIYDGSDKLLYYDNKGRLKNIRQIDFDNINITKGNHSIRVTCEYSNTELELKGVVKLKDKVDIITL